MHPPYLPLPVHLLKFTVLLARASMYTNPEKNPEERRQTMHECVFLAKQ